MPSSDPNRVWRAVADPTRRRLVELLRDGPRTTGDLCRSFGTSRFAVMKHLGVLERSGLLSIERRGRERWNALNPAPLREIERRWRSEAPQPATSPARRPAAAAGLSVFRLREEVYVDAPPGRVFDAITFNISAWWGGPYLVLPDATRLVVEAQLGGRFYEESGHRQGVIRGIVTAIRQDECLELSGSIAGGGPLPGSARFDLERREGGTLLRVEHVGLADAAGTVDGYRAMWRDLVRVRLKAFVEG